jgi:hypothetical protein
LYEFPRSLLKQESFNSNAPVLPPISFSIVPYESSRLVAMIAAMARRERK